MGRTRGPLAVALLALLAIVVAAAVAGAQPAQDAPPADAPPSDGPAAPDAPPSDAPAAPSTPPSGAPAAPSTPPPGASGAPDAPSVSGPPAAAPLPGEAPLPGGAPLPGESVPVAPAPGAMPLPGAAPPAPAEPAAAAAPAPVDSLPPQPVQTLAEDPSAPLPPAEFDELDEFDEPLPDGDPGPQEPGRWSGALHSSLGYFWERSTRVVMPEVEIEAESPTGVRVSAGYLVDVITSASIGFGVTEDNLHREYRHQPAFGLGKEFAVGADSHLDVQVDARMSTEPDYTSLPFLSGNFALSLNERNTVVRFGGSVIRDTILSSNDPTLEEHLSGYSGVVGVEQVLNPYMVASALYQLGHLRGFLGNVYRIVQIEAAPIREDPPDTRTRHALSMKLQGIIPSTGTALHLIGKGYTDSWGVDAVSPEARLYQSVGESLLLRLRYRYYRQKRADFHRDVYLRGWQRSTTSDSKLAAIESHMIGLRVDVVMGFLSDTVLDFAREGSVWIAFDKQYTDISYGPAELGTVGGTLPF